MPTLCGNSQYEVSAKSYFVPVIILIETYFSRLGYKISLKPDLCIMLAYGVSFAAKRLFR